MMREILEKIISGGQTGVDRAALDVALSLGIPCGGACPKGRKAEDSLIPSKYPLQETSSPSYSVRTRKNVENADGSLIFTWGPPTGGTLLTIRLAKEYKKPYFIVDLRKNNPLNNRRILEWGRMNQIKVLNIAGPRESEVPGIYNRAFLFINELLLSSRLKEEQVVLKFPYRCPYCNQTVSYDQFDLKIGENEIQCPSCKKVFIKIVSGFNFDQT